MHRNGCCNNQYGTTYSSSFRPWSNRYPMFSTNQSKPSLSNDRGSTDNGYSNQSSNKYGDNIPAAAENRDSSPWSPMYSGSFKGRNAHSSIRDCKSIDSMMDKTYTSTYTALVGNQRGTSALSKSSESSSELLNVYTGSPAFSPNLQVDIAQVFTQIAQINDHLLLCSLNAITPEKLRHYNVSLVVSAMIDQPPPSVRTPTVSNIHVCVEDVETANLKVHFDRVADRIYAEMRKGGRILVHCMAGVSRSTSLVLAYLVKYQGMSLANAFQMVRAARPCVHPNPGFWRQLVEFEIQVRGMKSVNLVPGYQSSMSNSSRVRSYSNSSAYGLLGGRLRNNNNNFNHSNVYTPASRRGTSSVRSAVLGTYGTSDSSQRIASLSLTGSHLPARDVSLYSRY